MDFFMDTVMLKWFGLMALFGSIGAVSGCFWVDRYADLSVAARKTPLGKRIDLYGKCSAVYTGLCIVACAVASFHRLFTAY